MLFRSHERKARSGTPVMLQAHAAVHPSPVFFAATTHRLPEPASSGAAIGCASSWNRQIKRLQLANCFATVPTELPRWATTGNTKSCSRPTILLRRQRRCARWAATRWCTELHRFCIRAMAAPWDGCNLCTTSCNHPRRSCYQLGPSHGSGDHDPTW